MDASAQDFVPVEIIGDMAPPPEDIKTVAKRKNYRPSLAAWLVAWDKCISCNVPFVCFDMPACFVQICDGR